MSDYGSNASDYVAISTRTLTTRLRSTCQSDDATGRDGRNIHASFIVLTFDYSKWK